MHLFKPFVVPPLPEALRPVNPPHPDFEPVHPILGAMTSFVVRLASGELRGEFPDLVSANRHARALKANAVVYKITTDGEVPMSYSGPGGWSGQGHRKRAIFALKPRNA